MSSLAPPLPPKTEDPAAAARVLQRFRQIFTAARMHYQQVERQVGIGGAQVWALGVIAAQPGLGVGALARAMHLHQSTASNLVRALAERSLIDTERHPGDRRAVRLRLAPEGAALLARVPGPFTGLLPQALGQLDGAALARLEADLAQLLHVMGVADDAPGLPIAQL